MVIVRNILGKQLQLPVIILKIQVSVEALTNISLYWTWLGSLDSNAPVGRVDADKELFVGLLGITQEKVLCLFLALRQPDRRIDTTVQSIFRIY